MEIDETADTSEAVADETADITEAVAKRMIEARALTGKSRLRVGTELGITERTYAKWERLESLGFMSHLDNIARVLETTTMQLMGKDPEAMLGFIAREQLWQREMLERIAEMVGASVEV